MSARFDTGILSLEEVAEALTVQEGQPVTAQEVRMIESRALRKLRYEFARRGLGLMHLAPEREIYPTAPRKVF